MHQLVAHGVIVQHNYDDKRVGIHINDVKPFNRHLAPGRKCQCRIIRQLGCQAGYITDGIVQLAEPLLQTGIQFLCLFQRKLLLLHQLVDIHSVSQRCGHAPCRGMRLLQITHVDELCKLIADRGGRTAQPGFLRQSFASYRFSRYDIFINNCCQYFLFSFADFHLHSLAASAGTCRHCLLALISFEC